MTYTSRSYECEFEINYSMKLIAVNTFNSKGAFLTLEHWRFFEVIADNSLQYIGGRKIIVLAKKRLILKKKFDCVIVQIRVSDGF